MTLVALIVVLAVIGVILTVFPTMDARIRQLIVLLAGFAVILWLLQLANLVRL